MARDRGLPEGLVLVRPARIGQDHRQGDLAVAEIVAGILAHGRAVRFIVDRVVDQLEGDAKVAAIDVERMLFRFAAVGDHGGNAAGGGEQGGGLGADDVEILFFAGVDLALGGQLVDLALGDDRRCARQDLEHLERLGLDHQLERAGEEEVADQHGGAVAPDDVGGLAAAAQARSVDDIVMQQRGSVDELDRCGQLVMARSGIADQVGAGECQHRPQPLAAAGDQMTGQFRDQRDARLHPVQDHAVHLVHAIGDERHDGSERRGAGAADRVDVAGGGCSHDKRPLAGQKADGKRE